MNFFFQLFCCIVFFRVFGILRKMSSHWFTLFLDYKMVIFFRKSEHFYKMSILENIIIVPIDALLGFKSCGQSMSSVKGCRKRSLPGVGDGPKEKRQKMDHQNAKNECNMGELTIKHPPWSLLCCAKVRCQPMKNRS